MAKCRFYGRVQVSCLWPLNVNQIRQALLHESTQHNRRCSASAILSTRRPGRSVLIAHDTLLRVMSIVIFTFTPVGIQHAFVTVRFKPLYCNFAQMCISVILLSCVIFKATSVLFFEIFERPLGMRFQMYSVYKQSDGRGSTYIENFTIKDIRNFFTEYHFIFVLHGSDDN